MLLAERSLGCMNTSKFAEPMLNSCRKNVVWNQRAVENNGVNRTVVTADLHHFSYHLIITGYLKTNYTYYKQCMKIIFHAHATEIGFLRRSSMTLKTVYDRAFSVCYK